MGPEVIVATEWLKGQPRHSATLWTDGKVIKSYGPSGWKIAEKIEGEEKVVRIRKSRSYSKKTTEHFAAVRSAVNELARKGYRVEWVPCKDTDNEF